MLCSSLITLAGVVCFATTYPLATSTYDMNNNPGLILGLPFGGEMFSFAYWFPMMLARLVHFTLLAGCLQLVFQGPFLAKLLAPALTLVAVVSGYWNIHSLFEISWIGRGVLTSSTYETFTGWSPLFAPLLSLLALCALAVLLLYELRPHRMQAKSALGLIFMFPLLAGLLRLLMRLHLPGLRGMDGVMVAYKSAIMVLVRSVYSHLLPAIEVVCYIPTTSYQTHVGLSITGVEQTTPVAVTLFLASYLISALLLWLTLVTCLEAAGNPQRPIYDVLLSVLGSKKLPTPSSS